MATYELMHYLGLRNSHLGLMLLFALPGTPTLYYGDELGLPNADVPADGSQDIIADAPTDRFPDLAGDGSTGTGEKGDHLVMICTVASTASGGVTSSETLTVAWDEI